MRWLLDEECYGRETIGGQRADVTKSGHREISERSLVHRMPDSKTRALPSLTLLTF